MIDLTIEKYNGDGDCPVICTETTIGRRSENEGPEAEMAETKEAVIFDMARSIFQRSHGRHSFRRSAGII